ncbi:MAG TPA: tetratricopeptide repeat protein [Candidatus Acidoferrum sp.]|nr:tetratricopeptide repeat protein [Candidatus Acidoferrum sp.]
MSKLLETKKRILEILRSKKMTVSELSDELRLSRATVRQHIKEMLTARAIEEVPNRYFKKHLSYKAVSFGSEALLGKAKQHWRKGNALFEEKKYGEALMEFSKAISTDPNYSDAYFNRALTERMMDNIDKAIKDLGKVMQLEPKSHDAAILMGDIEEKIGNLSKAKSWYEKALKFYPNYTDAATRLQKLVNKIKS